MARFYRKIKYRKSGKKNIKSVDYKINYNLDDEINYNVLQKGTGYTNIKFLIKDLPATRNEAIKKNLPYFFSGIKCKKGHIAPIYTRAGQCVSCKNIFPGKSKQNKKIYNRVKHFSLETKILELMKMARNRARQYEQDNYEYDLDLEYMKKLWLIQNGKCFYTNVKLKINDYFSDKYNFENKLYEINNFEYLHDKYSINRHDGLIASIDKVIPEKGYVKNNVVFCTRVSNYMKHDLSLKDFKNYSREISIKNLSKDLSSIEKKIPNTTINENLFKKIDRKEAKNIKRADNIFNILLDYKRNKNSELFVYDIAKYVGEEFKKNPNNFNDILVQEYKDKKSYLSSEVQWKVTKFFSSLIRSLFRKERTINGYKLKIVKSKQHPEKGRLIEKFKEILSIEKI